MGTGSRGWSGTEHLLGASQGVADCCVVWTDLALRYRHCNDVRQGAQIGAMNDNDVRPGGVPALTDHALTVSPTRLGLVVADNPAGA